MNLENDYFKETIPCMNIRALEISTLSFLYVPKDAFSMETMQHRIMGVTEVLERIWKEVVTTFTWRDWRKPRKLESRESVLQLRFEARLCGIPIWNFISEQASSVFQRLLWV
jgi:hypothetical protein